MPELNLPNFAGDPLIKTWQTFLYSFNAAVNSNPVLDQVQKFNYLRAQLHGDESRSIAGLPLTSANYEHTLSPLQNCFGEPQKIVSVHMQALLDIPKPHNSLLAIRQFLDSIENHVRGLSALGKSEEPHKALLAPIILRKLPIETRRNLAREHTTLEWTFNELREGILREIKVLKSGLSIDSSIQAPTETHIPMMTAASLHTGTSFGTKSQSLQPRRPTCVYCKSFAHASSRCDVVTDRQKRIDIVIGKNLLF